MQKTSLIMAALAAVTSAVTGPVAGAWVWSITDFQGGCSPAACTFGFNITAPDYLSFEGFKTECTGNTLQNGGNYVDCDQCDANKTVSAKLGKFIDVDGEQKIETFISYKYVTPVLPYVEASYNFTAEGAGAYGSRNPSTTDSFSVYPTGVTISTIDTLTS